MTEVVVTTGAISRAKLQSNHHQQTNTQLFTGRTPFLSPNQQCQSTEGLRYGTCFQGISQFYLHTHTFTRSQNEPYLPLPSQESPSSLKSLNLMSLVSCSDVPTVIGVTFACIEEQFWLEALAVITN